MFRNFLLADRILRSLGCTPVSYPPLPPGIAEHPLWRAWDLACETLLFQLMQDGILGNHVMTQPVKNPAEDDLVSDERLPLPGTVLGMAQPAPLVATSATYTGSSPFFSEQLTAFEVWLEFTSIHKVHLSTGTLESPEQLPVVLQVLLSQVHRVRALLLLRRFLDLGPWAVNLALSLGIFPYVMKLLQSPEYKSLLVSIWASILAFDPSCRVDLLKDGAFHHFVQHFMYGLNNNGTGITEAAKERTLAAYVLSICCHDYPPGQAECARLNLHVNCCALLSSYQQGDIAQDRTVELHLPSHFRFWLIVCLANMVKDNVSIQNEAYRAGVHSCLFTRLKDRDPDVRAAVCYALGCLIGSQPKETHRSSSFQDFNSMDHSQQGASLLANHSGVLGPNFAGAGQGRTTNQFQPTFQPQADGPNLQWKPQQMETMHGQAQQRMSVGVSLTGQQFFNQSVPLRSPQVQGSHIQSSHTSHGHPMQPHPSPENSASFLSGGHGGHGHLMTPQMHSLSARSPPPEFKPVRPSVYDDIQRLEIDLNVIDTILKVTSDGSVVVRYEATMALASAVAKYRDAFVAVADERNNPQTTQTTSSSCPIPRGLDMKHVGQFRETWEALRLLQHGDPSLSITCAANKVVSFVHEHVLQCRMESERKRVLEQDEVEPSILDGIDEEPNMTRTPLPVRIREGDRPSTSGGIHRTSALRRVLSDGMPVDGTNGSMEQNVMLGTASSHAVTSELGFVHQNLPESNLFTWKKDTFDTTFEYLDDENWLDLDPLSPAGASKASQAAKIAATRDRAWNLEDRYASLAPKPPKPTRQSIQMILEQEDEEALEAAEEEVSLKKKELELSESKIFRNAGVTMTTMLRFHPFEDVLVSCGGTGSVVVWDTEIGSNLTSFDNGNPTGSRMTTSGWMNEESSSLFYIGCDDGTVRLWGDLIPSIGKPPSHGPSLVSAFHALPMKAGQRGSGLVCEWQQWSGALLSGGNSANIFCWDLEYESLFSKIETNSEANVTTLTTAWDMDQGGQLSFQEGFGPDTLVAGFGDGTLRVFDLRIHRSVQELNNPSASTSQARRRQRPNLYKEHKSWVVSTAFAGHSNRCELISGTVAGEIKA